MTDPAALADERRFEATIRPRRFDEFVGQQAVRDNLTTWIEAAGRRGEVLDHVLLSGLPGLGKTTLAQIIAHGLGRRFVATSGPALEKPGDLAGILTKLEHGDVLFIDEIHGLRRPVAEALYSAMEDFAIDIVLDSGPDARTLRIDVHPFTLVGATTRDGRLPPPFRARFGVVERLDTYPWEDLARIVTRSAGILDVPLAGSAAEMLARRARGTPRVVNRFLRRVRDVAEVRGTGTIDDTVALEGLRMLGVDEAGLEPLDRKILACLARAGGGPLGLKTIAVTVGEEEETLEEVYEPFLIQQGFITKSPRGRLATDRAFMHLGLTPPSPRETDSLF